MMPEPSREGGGEGREGASAKRQRTGRSGSDEGDDAGVFAVATAGKGGGGGVVAAAPAGKPSVEDVLAAAAGGQGTRRTKALIALVDMAKAGGDGSVGIDVASAILASVKPLLSEAGADTHTLSLAISVLEALACSAPPAPAEEAATGRGGGVVSAVVQEMVETASAPSTPNRVLQRCLLCLERIGASHPSHHRPGLAAVATLALREGPPHCRRVALRLLAQPHVLPPEEAGRVLANFARDPDSSVRAAAVSALRHVQVDLALYRNAVRCLSDDYPSVRAAALKLACRIGSDFADVELYRGHEFAPDGLFGKARLCDNAFMQACSLVFDADVSVRVVACSQLGNIPGVSPQYLLQTLTKKMLTANQLEDVQQSAAEAEGDFQVVTGSSLLSADAAGALVVSLEDEFWEVRVAAIRSICRLASRSRLFRDKSVDVLIDMLSDEIETVRMAAIESLSLLRMHLELSEEHLQTVLSLLDDVSEPLRRSVHALLGCIPLTTPAALHTTVSHLLRNIRKYSADTPHVYRCLAAMGRNLSSLAEEVTPRLLTVDSPYLTTEAQLEDPTYVGILVLVLSAASVNPHVLSLVPSHCLRHWRCLREKEPHVTPRIEVNAVGRNLLEYRPGQTEGGGPQIDKQRDVCIDAARRLLTEVSALVTVGRRREASRMIKQGISLVSKASGWRGGDKGIQVNRMQLHLRSLKTVCDLQMACGQGREMTASCRSPHDMCKDLGMLALELDHGFQHAPAASQCRASSCGSGNGLLCFALAASALLSGGTHQDGLPVRGLNEKHGSEIIASRHRTLAPLLSGHGVTDAQSRACNETIQQSGSIESLRRAVDSFWIEAPVEGGAAETGSEVVERCAKILSGSQWDDQRQEEFDWRLPHRLPVELSVEGCSDSRRGCLSLAMSTGADPPRILALTVADSIDVDDAGGGAKGRIVRGSVLLEFHQAWIRPGYVYFQPVWMPACTPAQASAVRELGGTPWLPIGPTQRHLIHPAARS